MAHMIFVAPETTGVGISRCPEIAARLLRRLPLLPLALASQRLVENLARRHPSLFVRLGDHAQKVFLIEPTDIPVSFRLIPSHERPILDVQRHASATHWDARIAGPFAALIGLVHGAFDGDALFFSRDIVIEGDTEAVLALRYAIDDAEIDLVAEIVALFLYPPDHVLEGPLRRLLSVAEWATGIPLSRAGEARGL